jgi:methionyl aminopeptidase
MIYNCPHTGPKTILRPGMVICLEPMLTQGSGQTVTASDGWKVWTRDGGLAAHEEAMVLITEDGHKVLT